MKKLMIVVIGLLLSFQMLQADVEKTVVLNAGYNAVQFDANVTLGELKEKIGIDNLLMIQGAGQGSTYKKKYVEDGLDFLNSFKKIEFGKAYWIKVNEAKTFTYMAESYVENKGIVLNAGWSFVGPPLPLTLEEIKSQLNKDRAGNLLVIQGSGQGSTYKKEYEGDLDFLNTFKKFEAGKGYWVKVEESASLSFIFKLDKIAKDNAGNSAEITRTIAGEEYTIRIYSEREPTTVPSQGTIVLYGNLNGEVVSITINDSYPENSRFQIKVLDEDGNEMVRSAIIDFNTGTINFSDMEFDIPCISRVDLEVKIANNENVTEVNTGCITDMSNLFSSYDNFNFNQDIGDWNVSSVTNMSNMFHGSIFNQDIGNWDVSHVTDMHGMFSVEQRSPEASYFNQDIGSWDVSNVTDMHGMFLGYLDSGGYMNPTDFNKSIENWDVSNVTNMSDMFSVSHFNQNLRLWNVSNVTDMSNMFSSSDFNKKIGAWNVSTVTDMSGMFSNSKFNQDIGDWDVSSVIKMNFMFGYETFNHAPNYSSYGIFNQDISSWNVSSVTNMYGMFYRASFNQDISSWDVSNVTNMGNMLKDTVAFSSINYDALLNGWCNLTLQDNVSLSIGTTKYSDAGATCRQKIIDIYNWNITDGGAFELEIMAKDNSNHDVEKVEIINGIEYKIRVYSDSRPSSETSQSTIAIYGKIYNEMVVFSLNDTYPSSTKFQVKVFDTEGNKVEVSEVVNYSASSISVPDIIE